MLDPILDGYRIAERVYNNALDLYSVFAKAIKRKRKPYIVAWQPRGNDYLYEEQKFSNKKSAKAAFQRAVEYIDEPEMELFQEDRQQQAVYDWEEISADPFAITLDFKTLRKINRQVAKDYNMETPKLRFIEEGQSSTYDPSDHSIELSDKTNITLLHEIAHAIVNVKCSYEGREHAAHSPLFVWTVIELYHRYAGLDLTGLILSASQRNLLGDMSATQYHDRFSFAPNYGPASSQKFGQAPDDGHGGPR